jgi:hypothetical protein
MLQRGGAFMRKGSRLLSAAFSILALIIGVIALPAVAVRWQSFVPPPQVTQLKVRNWAPPVHPTLVALSQAALAAQVATAKTIPMWQGKDPSNTYTFNMVGTDPTIKGAGNTTIPTFIIPLRFTTSTAPVYVFDPENDDSCSPGKTPALNMVQASPIFKTITKSVIVPVIGDSLGVGQFASLFQRANFFAYTAKGAISPNYQVTLEQVLENREENVNKTITLPAITSPTPAPNVLFGPCKYNPVGLYEVHAFDSLVTTTLLPDLYAHGVKPTTLAVFLLANVVLYDTDATTGCCILAYHSAMIAQNNAVQTYVVADYDTSGGLFPGAPDITAMAGAIGGWMNDPVPNSVALSNTIPPPAQTPPPQSATPCYVVTLNDQIVPVGSIDFTQIASQNILEPVDPVFPLTTVTPGNNVFGITMSKFTYHVPDLAFTTWFYDGSVSTFNKGWSLFGTVPKPPTTPPC